MKKFKVALDEQEIRKCADEIKLYKSNLELAIKRNIRGIAMWAADVAQDAFGNSVVVDFEPIDDEGYSYRIIAEGADGRAVGFLEFGAGRLADASHPFAEEAPFPVGEAEYSVLNAQQYYRWAKILQSGRG